MSVIVSKRGRQKFGVITKALILARHTVKVCANEKNFPKKYRWILTKEMIVESLKIVTNIRKANNLDLRHPELRADRYRYQMEANGSCEALLTLIEVAWGILPLSEQKVEYWTGLVVDVEEALAAWLDSDKRRVKELSGKIINIRKAA